MIYTVGIDTKDFRNVKVEDVKRYFKDKELVEYDSETSGFDPYTCDLLCFQLGDKENQFVIAGNLLLQFKEFLEDKTLIGHNIKFDLKFMYHQTVYPTKVWDTYLAECVIKCGIKEARKSLAEVARNRLGIFLDKTVRANIGREGLTKRVIEYSAGDVTHLGDIRNSQLIEIEHFELQHTINLENQFVLALAYIEYCGFKLDEVKWNSRLKDNIERLKKAEQGLNDLLVTLGFTEYVDRQLDLFSASTAFTINWSSSRQIVELFKKMGIPVSKEDKESVEAKNIEKYVDKYPIIKPYLEYKEIEKIITTYGNTFISQINPISNRIHTNFRQVMDTGRLSSGGSDKNTGEKYLNFQNIPSDKETRSCFISEEGNTLVICDYSGQEQIVLANKCLDVNLLKFYDDGLGDMHSFVASKMYRELEDLSLEEIKTKHKDKRQAAKVAGFSINYGGVGATIAKNNNVTLEEGDFIYESYFKAFPGLKKYFSEVKKEGLDNGFILINDIIKRKSFISNYDEYLELTQIINRDFWDRWKVLKQGDPNPEFLQAKEHIKRFFKIKGTIERMSLNYPIQGTSADITKISAIYFFKWIRDNNYLNIVKFVNQVHDENVVECPVNLVDEVKTALEDCMKRAGAIFCKRVPLEAEAGVSKFWTK